MDFIIAVVLLGVLYAAMRLVFKSKTLQPVTKPILDIFEGFFQFIAKLFKKDI